MRTSILADLLNVVLKSSNELSRLQPNSLGGHPSAVPLYDLALKYGQRSMSCSRNSNGVMELTAEQDGLKYKAALPSMSGSLEDLKVSVSMTVNSTEHNIAMAGSDFLEGKGVPDAFKPLHSVVVAYVKHYCPSLLEGQKLVGSAAQSNATVTNQSPTKEIKETAETGKAPPNEQQNQNKPELSEFRIRPSNGPDIQFKGRRLVSMNSAEHRGRFFRFSVFETASGKVVFLKEGLTRWLNEKDNVSVKIHDSHDVWALMSFFGESPLSRAICEYLGQEYVQLID